MSLTPRSSRICAPTPYSFSRGWSMSSGGRCDAASTSETKVGRVVPDEHDDAAPFLADHAHGFAEHVALPPFGGQHVVEEIDGVHAHERRLGARDIALHQRDMLLVIRSC